MHHIQYPQQGNRRMLQIQVCSLLFLALTLFSAACSAPAATQQRTTTQASVISQPIVYTALGASDAVGIGAALPDSQGYVFLLTQHLAKGTHTVNLGISGIHLHEALQKELPIALSTNPRLVTIWLVANDFIAHVPLASYTQDLTTLLQRLQAQTQASIYIANLPDLTLLPSVAKSITASKQTVSQVRLEIQQWNAQIASVAKKYHATVVDLYQTGSQITAHPEYVSRDGFHPSAAGYARLASYFWDAIRKNG